MKVCLGLLSVLFCVSGVWAQCSSNADCPDGYYCKKAEGDCDGVGEITIRPSACPAIWDPVCGCDGKTYANACEAAKAGVNILSRGQCQAATCADNNDCPDGYYCYKLTGDCDGLGNPVERPTSCPEVWEPVCGCDGQTYSNACTAALFGVSVAYEGRCQLASINSSIRQTTSVSSADCSDEYVPVCGCDGQTYTNACWATANGVKIEYPGECIPAGAHILMIDPNVANDDVHSGKKAIHKVRVAWSEPVVFTVDDLYIEDEVQDEVAFTLQGSGTSLMTIVFDPPLQQNLYTLYIFDSVYDASAGLPIDGDGDGMASGHAVFVMEHRRRADFNRNNRIDVDDLAVVADLWLTDDPNE